MKKLVSAVRQGNKLDEDAMWPIRISRFRCTTFTNNAAMPSRKPNPITELTAMATVGISRAAPEGSAAGVTLGATFVHSTLTAAAVVLQIGFVITEEQSSSLVSAGKNLDNRASSSAATTQNSTHTCARTCKRGWPNKVSCKVGSWDDLTKQKPELAASHSSGRCIKTNRTNRTPPVLLEKFKQACARCSQAQ